MDKNKDSKNKRSKAVTVIETIIIIIAAAVFLVSAFFLLRYYWTGIMAEDRHAEEREMIESDAPTPEAKYSKLYDQNHDFIGWVSIEGTNVSYPVMHTPDDPEFYLHANFNKEYEYAGVPFLDAKCNANPEKGGITRNLIIYGHNMKNRTMFSALTDYSDKSFCDEHPIINFDTLWEEGRYQVVAVIMTDAWGEDGVDGKGFQYSEYPDFASEEEFNTYMQNVNRYKLYDTGVEVVYGDRLLTLSTCQYTQEDGRCAIIAKKIN
ncbi:MAG: class B sortase [Lachnospiraceae bacterium]|nr:class B sortase [Lachnospiraceae bacterium]